MTFLVPFGFAGALGDALAAYGLLVRLHRAGVNGKVSVSDTGALTLHTQRGDLAEALAADSYRPVYAPWNQGGGLVPGASAPGATKVLNEVRASTHPRLRLAREGLGVMGDLVEHCERTGAYEDGRIIDKARIVRACAGLSGLISDWPRTCVSIRSNNRGYAVNPITASGGNSGRSEWSVVHASALLALTSGKDDDVEIWRDLLDGGRRTRALTVSPSSFLSRDLAAEGRMNPAWMVLVVEGLCALRSPYRALWPTWPHVVRVDAFPNPMPVVGSAYHQVVLPVPPRGDRVGFGDVYWRLTNPVEPDPQGLSPWPFVDDWGVALWLLGSTGTESYADPMGVLRPRARSAPLPPDQPWRTKWIDTMTAAEIAGLEPGSFRGAMSRLREKRNVDLRAPQEVWPDGRTPLWDGRGVTEWATARRRRTSQTSR